LDKHHPVLVDPGSSEKVSGFTTQVNPYATATTRLENRTNHANKCLQDFQTTTVIEIVLKSRNSL
jgi:hypothetical protein